MVPMHPHCLSIVRANLAHPARRKACLVASGCWIVEAEGWFYGSSQQEQRTGGMHAGDGSHRSADLL
jgi:hypothetical protein